MNTLEVNEDLPTLYTTGIIQPPEGYDDKQEIVIIIPDDIVGTCTNLYRLNREGFVVLDPMSGFGTIPRVVQQMGGKAFGCEIDEQRYFASVANGAQNISLGDFRDAGISDGSVDCIFTSIPFAWFKNSEEMAGVDPNFAQEFKRILAPGGFILLDTIQTVHREGEEWHVAENQCSYLTDNGFEIQDIVRFKSTDPNDPNPESLIIKFVVAG